MVDYDAQGQGFKRLSRNKLKYLFMLSTAYTGATARGEPNMITLTIVCDFSIILKYIESVKAKTYLDSHYLCIHI